MQTETMRATPATDFLVAASGLRVDLFTADEIRAMRPGEGGDPVPAPLVQDSLVRILDWCENFLGKPSPVLGRSGNVCPFVPEAMMRDSLKIAVVELSRGGAEAVGEIEEIVVACRRHFLSREAADGKMDIFRSMVLVFPGVADEEAPTVIDPVQRKLKPSFVEAGLMLGEFHRFSPTPGLRNKQFRPLRSPIPLLAIRHMVESDVDFLMAPNDPPATRVRSLSAYLNFLGPSLSASGHAKASEALWSAEAESQQAQGPAGAPVRDRFEGWA